MGTGGTGYRGYKGYKGFRGTGGMRGTRCSRGIRGAGGTPPAAPLTLRWLFSHISLTASQIVLKIFEMDKELNRRSKNLIFVINDEAMANSSHAAASHSGMSTARPAILLQ